MADPNTLRAAALTVLATIPHVSVFDADVPTKPPADTAGRALPYVVLWGSAGIQARDSVPLSLAATSTLTFEAVLTCAGGTPARVMQLAHLVRAALTGTVLAGSAPLVEVTSPRPVAIDRDVSPPRYFTPLMFRALAP